LLPFYSWKGTEEVLIGNDCAKGNAEEALDARENLSKLISGFQLL